jgi:ABC-2 type transport system ATP-binding protein
VRIASAVARLLLVRLQTSLQIHCPGSAFGHPSHRLQPPGRAPDVLREVVLELRKTGTTVIFSTHDMRVAEKMCDFIFMIYRGNKVLDGTLESIQDRYGSDTIRVRVEGNGFHPQAIPGVEKVTDFGRLQELRLAATTDPQAVLAELIKRGPVMHFELTRPSLHDIFVRIASPDAADMMQPAAKGAAASA